MHAIFFLAPPLALTDIFNYVNYGRMEVVHHLNPYTTIPILEPHNDPSYELSNWHQLLSPYGPLFTLLTFVVVPLGVAASFWVLKGAAGAGEPGDDLARVEVRAAARARPGRGDRARRAEPDRARVGARRRPQRLPDGVLDRARLLPAAAHARARRREARTDAGASGARRRAATSTPRAPARAAGRARGWLLPLCAAEIGAGAAFVTAAAIKASGGGADPGRARRPARDAAGAWSQVVLGMAWRAAVVAGALSLIAFGLHIPDLSTQSRLVTNVSVPNLIGLALGQGGETETLHMLLSAALVVSVLLCCVQAWRRRASITASGWASVALLVTLSWVLPWYVLWVLPLAALSSSRRLRVTALALGVYLIIAWAPASGLLWNAIGFHPRRPRSGACTSAM